MKTIHSWITIRSDVQPNIFECSRCKVTRQVHLPAAIADFVKQGEAFSESHKYCRVFFITACGCYREMEIDPCPPTFKLPLKYRFSLKDISDAQASTMSFDFREFELSDRTMKIGENYFPVYDEIRKS